MSRALSAGTMDALFAQETGECFLYLVEVNHADFAQPLRITNNAVDVVSNGDTYQNYPLKMTLPKDDPDVQQPSTKLIVGNVDRQVIALFRALATNPTCDVSIINGATPDTLEYTATFKLSDFTYNLYQIEATLSFKNILDEPIPKDTFNPAHFPGLF